MTTKKLIMNVIGIAGLFALMLVTTNNYLADMKDVIFDEREIVAIYGLICFVLGINFESVMCQYFNTPKEER